MNTLLLRRTWLPALLVVSACYDSGSPSVDNPRPAQACYFYTSTSIRYYVFQELEQGCGVLSIPPLATVPEGREPARQYDSSGVFWSRGFAQDPTVSVTPLDFTDSSFNQSQTACPALERRTLEHTSLKASPARHRANRRQLHCAPAARAARNDTRRPPPR